MTDVTQEDRHAETRPLWRAGQIWETLVDGETIWTPVGQGGRAEPLWDQHQAYRQCAHPPQQEERCPACGAIIGAKP